MKYYIQIAYTAYEDGGLIKHRNIKNSDAIFKCGLWEEYLSGVTEVIETHSNWLEVLNIATRLFDQFKKITRYEIHEKETGKIICFEKRYSSQKTLLMS